MVRSKVGVIVDSAREVSLSRRLALAMTRRANSDIEFERMTICGPPIFDQDVRRLKRQIQSASALPFLTPVHNRSISAMLKNTINWASRTFGAAVIGQPEAFHHSWPGFITPHSDVTDEEARLFPLRHTDQFDLWISRSVDTASTAA